MSTVADELRKLSELREAGSLTADEYLEAKALVLSGRAAARPAPADVRRGRPELTNYWLATAAFVTGLVAIPLAWIAVFPFAALIASACALIGCDENRHKNWWMAAAGLGLSLLSFLAMFSAHGLV